MAFDLEEQEKIANLKAWWGRFGNIITALLVVVVIGIAGKFGWDWYQERKISKALTYYEIVFNSSTKPSTEDLKRLKQANSVLQEDYASTPYTGRAALIASARFIDDKLWDSAAENLQWVLDHKKDFPALEGVARLQLASVLTNQEKYDEALSKLKAPEKGYESLYQDRKADVLYAKGDFDGAKAIWDKLVEQDLPVAFVNSIKLKLSVLNNANAGNKQND